jgi:hypothetical protein
MSFQIKACTIADVRPHPTLGGRVEGKVKVTLRETIDQRDVDHDLTLKVWANTTPTMSLAEINSALLGRAAIILKRTVAVADTSRLTARQPAAPETIDG